MSKDHGQGIFTMQLITTISKTRELSMAKSLAEAAINDSTATDANKEKARELLRTSSSLKKLLFGMTNFSLSHQGMKVLR